jgi:hypothetical protein
VRTAGLRHKTVNDAMKHDTVVKAVLHQFLDARNVPRREVRTHLDHNVALRRFQRQGIFRLGHLKSSHN